MTKYEHLIQFTNAILTLLPDSNNLQWEKAVLLERQAAATLITKNKTKAIELFDESIQLRKKIIDETDTSAKTFDLEDWNEKRILLAKSCMRFAKICRSKQYFDKAGDMLRLAIEILRRDKITSNQANIISLLQKAHRILADLAPWEQIPCSYICFNQHKLSNADNPNSNDPN